MSCLGPTRRKCLRKELGCIRKVMAATLEELHVWSHLRSLLVYESSIGEQDLGHTMVIAVEEGFEGLGMIAFVLGLLHLPGAALRERPLSVSVGR